MIIAARLYSHKSFFSLSLGLILGRGIIVVPLMFDTSMLTDVSFSHARSMHSYTDCRISLGSSSTHLDKKDDYRDTLVGRGNIRQQMRDRPYPSLGKSCLISTWWWLSSAAVLELNTWKIGEEQKKNHKKKKTMLQFIACFYVHCYERSFYSQKENIE